MIPGAKVKEIKKRTQTLFDFPICIPFIYKLCDFKVAYGEIFSDWLREYDFWGYCDNDLVFGNIRKFITDEILETHDRILARGHFSLYRNSKNVNEMYKKASPSYRTVFSTESIWAFDEWPGTSRYWKTDCASRFYDKIIFDDLDINKFNFVAVHKKELDKGRTNFIYSFDKGKLCRIFLQNGGVSSEETMYVHFQKRKLRLQTLPSERFLMVPNCILPYEENIDVKFLEKYACKRYIYFPMILRKMKTLKKKIKHIIK